MPYQLERVTSRRHRVYHQLYNYYRFCEQTRQMSQSIINSKVYTLNNFIAVTALQDLRKIHNRHIYQWVNAQLARGNTGRSVNDRLAHLRAMLRWQQDVGLKMPHLQLGLITKVHETPARKVCFSRRTIEEVLAGASLQEKLLIRLAFDCGLRISELSKLRLSDINDYKITIIGKGDKRRYAFISTTVKVLLQEWVKQERITDYLWPSPIKPDLPLAICTLRQKMQAVFKRNRIEDFCPHDLRHSYATDLKNLGIPTRQIQAALGHSSEATTEQYLSDLDGLDIEVIYQRKYA